MQPCSAEEGKKEVSCCFVTMVGVLQSVFAKGTQPYPSILCWVMNARRRTEGVQCEFEVGVWAVNVQLYLGAFDSFSCKTVCTGAHKLG